jgi:hypothetical protein
MKQGFYGGATFPLLGPLGGGLYMDSHGNLYPQVYYGPGFKAGRIRRSAIPSPHLPMASRA